MLLAPILSFSQGLSAFLSYSAFNTPDNKPYLETYLTIKGTTVKYKTNQNGKLQEKLKLRFYLKKVTQL